MNQMLRRARQTGYDPAIVFGAAVNALSYVRSLGRRGVPVVCAETYRGEAAYSRYGAFVHLQTDAQDRVQGEHAADALIRQFNERDVVPIAFGSADQWQEYLSVRAETTEIRINSLVPSSDVMGRIIDKQAQYEYAERQGVRVPRFANARDVVNGREAWTSFPAIVKPRRPHLGRAAIGGKAICVNDLAELRSALARIGKAADMDGYLIQEFVDGRDDSLIAYLGCYDASGHERAWLVKRKLRQHPPVVGDGSLDVTCEDHDVAKAARMLLAEMDYRGMVGIEFKRDAQAGAPMLIEVNPRTVSTNQLAIASGVDFPWRAYRMLMADASVDCEHGAGENSQTASTVPYRVGVLHVNEEREMRSFVSRWRLGQTGMIGWLREMLSAESYAVWDRRDLRPFVAMIAKLAMSRIRRRRYSVEAASRKAGENAQSATGSLVSNGPRQA